MAEYSALNTVVFSSAAQYDVLLLGALRALKRVMGKEPNEHLYCYRLVGGPMDGSDHLMTMDVMEMAVPVCSAEEGTWELHSGSAGHLESSSPCGDRVSDVGYYHLYLWYGRIAEGSRLMEYHGYFSDDDMSEDFDGNVG